MTTMTVERHSANQGCGCGCEPQECCELECLVQPRFFCGQLLADQDLTALVDWVKGKSALARYRHGWGVVCGLDVHCGRQGSVTVSPGYALDCCGRDIVICKETALDLKDCWKRADDPCSGAMRPPQRDPAAGNGRTVQFGGLEIPANEVQAFDVYVRYSESATDARTALARGGCGGVAGCEYTRVHEGGELYCKPAEDCRDPNERAAQDWDDQYRTELEQLIIAIRDILALEDTRRIPKLLLDLLRRHPLHTFCFIREWLCDVQDDDGGVSPEALRNAAFWIVQDWRNWYFRVPCRGCGPETGVLLARVWVWGRTENNRERFSTLYVEPHAPFRRALAEDEFPAPLGEINGAPYIWLEAGAVLATLRGLGFTSVSKRAIAFNSVDDLRAQLTRANSLYLRPNGGLVSVLFFVDRCGRERVVAYELAANNLENARRARARRT